MTKLGCAWLLALATASCTDEGSRPSAARGPRPDELFAGGAMGAPPAAAAPDAAALGAPGGAAPPRGLLRSLASAASLRTRLPERAAEGFAVGDARSGVSIDVRLEGASDAAAERDGEARVFRGALPGADHRIELRDSGLEDEVRFVAAPSKNEIAYRVTLGANAAGLRLVAGVLEVLDAGGAPRVRVRAPALFDADGAQRALDLSVRGCAVDTSPRIPWGRAPTAPGAASCTVVVRWSDAGLRYPITVDPVWELSGEMAEPRSRHAAALLEGNRLLVAGGNTTVGDLLIASAEVYDLDSQTWAGTDPLPQPRRSMGALPLPVSAALPDGGALVTGGRLNANPYVTAGCDVYDVSDGMWHAVEPLNAARSHHVAVMLDDGSVLVAGGGDNDNEFASAERSTPTFSGWQTVGSMVHEHFGPSAAIVDGKVMVAGGMEDGATEAQPFTELFDPATNNFTLGPQMVASRAFFGMVELGDGRLLATGGLTAYVGFGFVLTTAASDIYDPAVGTWSPAEAMSGPRFAHTAVTLKNGLVLVHGGRHGGDQASPNDDIIYDSSILWDPVADAWTDAGTGASPRQLHSTTRFDSGEVLIVGGDRGTGFSNPVAKTSELWTLTANGEPCDDFKKCTSGQCIEGMCCDAACDGVCESCLGTRTGGDDGACAPVAAGTDPDNECLDSGAGACANNGACDGSGACQKYPVTQDCEPAACSSGEECSTGFCADGICCSGPCEGECRSCRGAANGVADGQCLPIAAGTDPENECADDGSTNCSNILLCDGNGACVTSNAVCAPYTCLDANGCKAECLLDADCLPTHRCDDNVCVERVPSCEGDMFVDADGNKDDCAPYGCDPANPSCKTSCQSAEDCANGFVCDGAGQCVSAPSAADDASDGCGCRTAGSPAESALPSLSALALALAAVRRRRRAQGARR